MMSIQQLTAQATPASVAAPSPVAFNTIESMKDYVPPPLTPQKEDDVIHARLTTDEKALRRVTKKFHSYTSVAYAPSASSSASVEDARDAFLVELASFHLSLKKNLMVCEAEARQVEEYQREKERIAAEHEKLRDEIEGLKTSLEHAQLERRRKIEYDNIAEKVNTLPTRAQLEESIRSLENDMVAIKAEQDAQTRTLQAQKSALDDIISDLAALRGLGKQNSDPQYETGEGPELQEMHIPSDNLLDIMRSSSVREESGELREDEMKEGEGNANGGVETDEEDMPLALRMKLNATARPFIPRNDSTPVMSATPEMVVRVEMEMEEDDIEMGELAEDPVDDFKGKKKPREEELEEGEASDLSSELSELPDD